MNESYELEKYKDPATESTEVHRGEVLGVNPEDFLNREREEDPKKERINEHLWDIYEESVRQAEKLNEDPRYGGSMSEELRAAWVESTLVLLRNSQITIGAREITDFSRFIGVRFASEVAMDRQRTPEELRESVTRTGFPYLASFLNGLIKRGEELAEDTEQKFKARLELGGYVPMRDIHYLGSLLDDVELIIKCHHLGKYIGRGSRNSTFIIFGDTDEGLARDSENSTFVVEGKVKEVAPTLFSKIYVKGDLVGGVANLEGNPLLFAGTEIYKPQKPDGGWRRIWPMINNQIMKRVHQDLKDIFKGGDRILIEKEEQEAGSAEGKLVKTSEDIRTMTNVGYRQFVIKMLSLYYSRKHLQGQTPKVLANEALERSLETKESPQGLVLTRKQSWRV